MRGPMSLKNQITRVIFYGILVVYLQYSVFFLSEFLDVFAESSDYCSQYAFNIIYGTSLLFVPAGVIIGVIAYLPLLIVKTMNSKFVAVYLAFTYLLWSICSYLFTFHVLATMVFGYSLMPFPLGVHNLLPYMICSVLGWIAWIKLVKAV